MFMLRVKINHFNQMYLDIQNVWIQSHIFQKYCYSKTLECYFLTITKKRKHDSLSINYSLPFSKILPLFIEFGTKFVVIQVHSTRSTKYTFENRTINNENQESSFIQNNLYKTMRGD